MTNEVILRVSSIRSQNPNGFGGCIFSGRQIDKAGNVVDARCYYVVKAGNRLLGQAKIQVGQWWHVIGESSSSRRDINGYQIVEWQMVAQDLSLLQCSGEHIVSFIAESDEFEGIGLVKARKLWDTFGEGLYGYLDRGDVSTLSKVLGESRARQVIAAWAVNGDTRTLQWLQKNGFNVSIGHKVIAFFGHETREKLEQDPYRLLSFCATWEQVDKLAHDHFDVEANDPRRLQGAVEEALYRIFQDGHTQTSISILISRITAILGQNCVEQARDALTGGLSNGTFIIDSNDRVHPVGAWIMETTVARAMASRLLVKNDQPTLHSSHVDAIIAEYEDCEGITLNVEQRLAIHTSASNSLSLIIGGAGVGKTTVLKALYKIYDEAKIHIFQVALAGRAAKRMTEATGRPALTIASFIKTIKENDLSDICVIVIDEASMVDIITMYRLCEMLPQHIRILLVGDTGQLMPVGPGLVLHALAKVADIPKVELKVVKRYGGEIALAAQSVREGIWPELSNETTSNIAFLPCSWSDIAQQVVSLYAEDIENTQILSSVKNGVEGTKAINTLYQKLFTRHNRPLLVHLDEFQSMAATGFYLGDQLLCSRNLWDWGLQNGSLGRLIEIEQTPRAITNANGENIGQALGWVLWDDGERRPILESMLDDLELGNAITVHKSQGSQWQRVIVVITGNRMLDRTLIYTAMTRAQNQVIMVGNREAARRAVESLPRASNRFVGLDSLLLSCLAQPEL